MYFKTNDHTLKRDGLKNCDRQRILSLSKTKKIQKTPRKAVALTEALGIRGHNW